MKIEERDPTTFVLNDAIEIGFRVTSLIERRVFIWAELYRGLTRAEIRYLKERLREFDEVTLFANIAAGNKINRKFAEFFGFKNPQLYGDVFVMERPATCKQ